jgi:hypothetical protein
MPKVVEINESSKRKKIEDTKSRSESTESGKILKMADMELSSSQVRTQLAFTFAMIRFEL